MLIWMTRRTFPPSPDNKCVCDCVNVHNSPLSATKSNGFKFSTCQLWWCARRDWRDGFPNQRFAVGNCFAVSTMLGFEDSTVCFPDSCTRQLQQCLTRQSSMPRLLDSVTQLFGSSWCCLWEAWTRLHSQKRLRLEALDVVGDSMLHGTSRQW